MKSERRHLEEQVIKAAKRWRADRAGVPRATVNDRLDSASDLHSALAALERNEISPNLEGPGSYVEGSPDTSVAAARLIAPKAGSVRRQILDQLAVVPEVQRGLTDEELEHRLRARHTTVSSARNWLAERGWIADSGYVRATSSKRDAVVWSLTPGGREVLMGLPADERGPKWPGA